MTDRSPEPRPTFSVVDLLAGYLVLGVLSWALGGAVAIVLGGGWAAGARVGGWLGLGLFSALVVRTIWLASYGAPNGSGGGRGA
jgi:hypothetical protein